MMNEFKETSFRGPAAPRATHSKITPAPDLTCIHDWSVRVSPLHAKGRGFAASVIIVGHNSDNQRCGERPQSPYLSIPEKEQGTCLTHVWGWRGGGCLYVVFT